MTRSLTYGQAINEAIAECMAADNKVYLVGLGVPGPTGVFGTTTGLVERFGSERVHDMPSSENAMTGVVLGTGLTGMRPILGNRGKRPGGQAAARWRMRSGRGRMGGAPGMSSRLPR